MLRWARLASDCTNAVISIAQTMLGPYNQITKEIKEDALAFQEMEFVHDRREANHDAHVLVRSSLFSSIGQHICFFDPPDGVCNSYSMT